MARAREALYNSALVVVLMGKTDLTFLETHAPVRSTTRVPVMSGKPRMYYTSHSPYLGISEKVGGNRTEFAAKDVLVVEDEAYLCELIGDVIESEGHTVRKASNGLEALERMRERMPQLVLLDLMMPVMDGWEFMDALRAEPGWNGVPIVIITAIYDVKRTQEETGALAVITKPFDIDQIVEIVRLYAS